MTEPLFEPPAPVHPLTDRQRIIWDYVRLTPGGITADELGAWLHAQRDDRWRHDPDDRCLFCGRDGNRVFREKALAQRLTRRKASGRYEPRDPADRAREHHGEQVSHRIPDDPFEGL